MAEEVDKPNGLMFVKLENQKIPEFKQVKGKDWVYWGEENDYPDYLIELFMRSSTHNAIITGKVNYIIGNGWGANKAGLTVNDETILNAFVKSINPEETLSELSEKIVLDFEIFNALAFEVIWSKSGKDFSLYHMPINKLRTNEDESKYFYSRDWSKSVRQDEEKTGYKELKPFDFEKKENGIFIYQITAPRKGKDPNVYPIPEYIGSTQAIETESEISNYNLSEIKTGFSAGTILNFYNGVPTEEAKKKIEKKIAEKFSGTDRAGSFILNFSDGKERGSDVVSLNGNDLEKRYIEVRKDVTKTIFVGHKVNDPSLFGAGADGVVFERQASILSQEQFQSSYVARRQRILEKIFNKFAKLKGVKPNLTISPVSVGYGIPDSLISQAMPIDFVKEKLGVPIPKEATSDSKGVIDAINSLSPLVANKVLESMSAEEIRGLVGLSGGVVNTTKRTETQMMSQEIEAKLLEAFGSVGRPKSDFHIYKRKELFRADSFAVAKEEQEYFKSELTASERAIIDLISKDEKMPASEIAKTLNISESEVEIQISSLVEREYLSPSKNGYTPSSEAIDITDEEGSKTHNIEILYSYEERKNAPKLKGESRPFCKERMKQDKFYTRAEIDSLSNGMGLDVWTFKGGWYTNPNTDAPTPQCRHIWVQNVVKRK